MAPLRTIALTCLLIALPRGNEAAGNTTCAIGAAAGSFKCPAGSVVKDQTTKCLQDQCGANDVAGCCVEANNCTSVEWVELVWCPEHHKAFDETAKCTNSYGKACTKEDKVLCCQPQGQCLNASVDTVCGSDPLKELKAGYCKGQECLSSDSLTCCSTFVQKKGKLSANMSVGATNISVADTTFFKAGDYINISDGESFEYKEIAQVFPTTRRLFVGRRLAAGILELTTGLQKAFGADAEIATVPKSRVTLSTPPAPPPAPAPAPAPVPPVGAPTPAPTLAPTLAPTPANTTAATADEKSSSSTGLSDSSSFAWLPSGASSSSGSLTSGSGTAWMWVALFLGVLACIVGAIVGCCAMKGKQKKTGARGRKKNQAPPPAEPQAAEVALPPLVSGPTPVVEAYTAPTQYETVVAPPVVMPTTTQYVSMPSAPMQYAQMQSAPLQYAQVQSAPMQYAQVPQYAQTPYTAGAMQYTGQPVAQYYQ